MQGKLYLTQSNAAMPSGAKYPSIPSWKLCTSVFISISTDGVEVIEVALQPIQKTVGNMKKYSKFLVCKLFITNKYFNFVMNNLQTKNFEYFSIFPTVFCIGCNAIYLVLQKFNELHVY